MPAILLTRWSRPRAEGLERLMAAASLMQSFPATPERPVPALWSERLGGVAASRFWRRQHRVWWQLWANHAETSPFLVLEVDREALAKASLPASALRVGDLLVVGEDATARRQLADSLRPLQRSRAGLPRLCLNRLQAGQAVWWNGAALGVIVGPVAPLLERFQVGCLSLALESSALRWQGEAAASDGSLMLPAPSASAESTAEGPPGTALAVPDLPGLVPLPASELLELDGASLDPLLGGLLERPIIRDPLASHYGLEGKRLEQARRTPFRLRLRPQPSGPFQASLELQLAVGDAQSLWLSVLEKISGSLLAQGYQSGPQASPSAGGPAASAPPQQPAAPRPAPGASPPTATRTARPQVARGTTLWRRADGAPVGGWSWIPDAGRPPQLLLFLGPTPSTSLPMPVEGGFRPGPGALWMRLRPSALAGLNLLPEEMPPLLQRADQLWIEAEPLPARRGAQPISRLRGRLQLSR